MGKDAKDGAANDRRVVIGRAGHEIIDAVSALLVNVEFLADKNDADQRAVSDARLSVQRIATLARAIQEAAETMSSSARKPR